MKTDIRVIAANDGKDLSFVRVPLSFRGDAPSDLFALKNNKTVTQTLAHPRYASLSELVRLQYASRLDTALGTFLLQLKMEGDQSYRRFLNKHGDLAYSTFEISDATYLNAIGVYAYFVGNELKYIGRCKDSMKKRINNGYGKIHPKNCYLDGQSTNCRLNALIAISRENVSLWFCPLRCNEIDATEMQLIGIHQSAWNV
jgi:hypothetical protein